MNVCDASRQFHSDSENVDALTLQLEKDGYAIQRYLSAIGDGYYESRVLDAKGNCIEITV